MRQQIDKLMDECDDLRFAINVLIETLDGDGIDIRPNLDELLGEGWNG